MKRSPVKPIQLTPETVQTIESAVFQMVEAKLEPRFYLLDVTLEKEAGYWYLRIYVEETGGAISLSDCETISRALEVPLEALPQLSDLSYNLEVSSPGLFRPLKRPREFEFFKGKSVRVEIIPPEAQGAKKGSKKPQPALGAKPGPDAREGILQGYDVERHAVILKQSSNGETVELPLSETHVVYLNPVIHFPELDEPISEDSDLDDPETGDILDN